MPEYETGAEGRDRETHPTALTIALVADAQARSGAADVAGRLAELAVTDELVVLYEVDERESGTSVRAVAVGLRGLMPRHAVVALHIAHSGCMDRDATLVDELLDIGSTPFVVAPAAVVADVVAEFYGRLHADRVLRLAHTLSGGFELQEVRLRSAAICGHSAA